MSVVLSEHLPLLASAPSGIQKLRGLVLELAVRGKLVPQDPSDEPASELLKRIAKERARLEAGGACKKSKLIPAVGKDEQPFTLPDGWVWSRLLAISLINPRNSADDSLVASFVPMAMIGTSFDGRHSQEHRKWAEIKQGFTHFAEGDIGVAKITPCFENSKACVLENLQNGIGAGTTELHIVRPISSTLVPRFVLAYLKAPMFLLVGETRMTGTAGQKRLPKDFLELNPFPLPPLAEQHRIVAKVDELMALCDRLEQEVGAGGTAHAKLVETLLGTLTQSTDADDLAANWQRLAEHFDTLFTTEASLDALKQTVLQLAVMGKLVPQDPSDEPASELLKRIAKERAKLEAEGKIKKLKPLPPVGRDEQLFALPNGWQWTRFSTYALEVSTGPFGSMLHKSDYVSGGIPLVNPSHMIGGRIVPESNVAVSEPKATELSSYRLRVGDIVMARRGEVGRTALVTENEEGWLCGTGSFVVRLAPKVSQPYVVMLFRSASVRRYLGAESVGITMVNLNHGILNCMPMALPPIAEQHRIVAKVDELMALCDRLKADLAESRTRQDRLATTLIETALKAA